ncbi:FitA-like ribbon-helix-helix domain-containing protein [Iamia sp.]|uniref:FitA-like ribbon-helix-helix domain-containing protein n=1 Tax=Iamia sp. TaxID=2722710 RepID=UPI002BF0EBDC|nr:hypothetical protein [Iamia sp.]HXH57188.1 hypothetical protein [Iamia sp.]
MATLTIRAFDDEWKRALQRRAAEHGRSMEAEARAILGEALDDGPVERGLASQIRRRVARTSGAELDIPERSDRPRAADLEA